MVEAIYELKNMLLEEMQQEAQERGIERLDKDRVDMVKDLAEAEKSCWEAEYYRSVSEAMQNSSGYGMSDAQTGYGGMSGAQMGTRQGSGRGGSQNGSRGLAGYRDSRGRYARRGYGMGYPMEQIREELQNADPQERERMVQELRQMIGGQM